jgi:hypothetical protein
MLKTDIPGSEEMCEGEVGPEPPPRVAGWGPKVWALPGQVVSHDRIILTVRDSTLVL